MANMLDYTQRAYFLGRRLPRLGAAIGPPHVIIGCSVHLFAVWAAYHLSRYYRARFIMEVRDLWPQTLLDMGVWRDGQPRVRFFRWLEQFLYERAERIITLSPLTGEYLARYSSSWAAKSVYIPNGTRIDRFQLKGTDQEDENRPLQITYLGAIGMANNLDLVLEAMRIVNSTDAGRVECVLVGDGPERHRLERQAQDWELTNVRFLGAVPREDVPSYLAQADILVLVQKEVLYGSSNKLFDYMASGKPVAFAIHAQHNNMVDAAGCGLSASPDSAQDLASKLLTLARMPAEERQSMGARGRKYVQQHHDYAILARRLVGVLKGQSESGDLGH
jgi:glycosyltransferase involved in cell wall biosynthesis